MGLLVDGQWIDQWYDTKKTGGRFVREESSFRSQLGSEQFPIEKGRYHLFISHACPWAHRVAIFREIKDLTDIVSMSVVEPHMGSNGWVLDKTSAPRYHKQYLHQIYQMADPRFTGRVTVPVLWDKEQKTIVNNESSELIRMFNVVFDSLTNNNDDYYPVHLQQDIDNINEYIYHHINNGVYKVGFATDQEVYDQAVTDLFDALDEIENRLKNQRYLVGSSVTEADIRLFTTLIRFDAVYVGHFKCSIRRIEDYPSLSRYVRDILKFRGINQTLNMEHIKKHYYTSHPTINPNQIVPLGPDLDYIKS